MPSRSARDAGRLRRLDGGVDLPLPVVGPAQHDGARAVGVVAVDARAEVGLHQVAGLQDAIGGAVVRDRGVRAGREDRLERDGLGAELEHPPLQVAGDLRLGASLERPGQQALQRVDGDLAGTAQGVDLAVVLDLAQALDDQALRRHGRDAGLRERGVGVDAQRVRLARPRAPVMRPAASPSRSRVMTWSRSGTSSSGLVAVAAVGQEGAGAVGGQHAGRRSSR